MQPNHVFSGAYLPGDVEFLLQPITMDMTSIADKEALIQSGEKHYSDMLSQEPAPEQWHLDLFARALDSGAERLARDVAQLALTLAQRQEDEPVILVSLVRAGVPLGVMLHHALRDKGIASFHYGISIIRDRGIDTTALGIIEQRHGCKGIIFVDGWTGKGAIAAELKRSLDGREGYPPQPRLVVLADPCGSAWLAASDDDWLIPFGIMGAPVSGLISRSVWSAKGLHGCVVCDHLREFECSRMLVDTVSHFRTRLPAASLRPLEGDEEARQGLQQTSREVIAWLAKTFCVDTVNRIKPGIAEATRAVLRRVPDHVFVRTIDDADVALLVGLAREKGIAVSEMGNRLGPYRAVTIIKKVR
ncbi:cysteine protease StiP domain-containing protein [Enterobacter sp. Bisph1]|uniref:cysteine protease StiP domain-containing protein n=1 Tax=Enterobacter sp. Bisph1 TaxID=1274399 RepID=UPI00057BEB9B|nr:cysteine protease StiP domain-containing protein [Enterobacter sp. Bisph1]